MGTACGAHFIGDTPCTNPKTDRFTVPLPVFRFSESPDLNLWLIAFCLESRKRVLPADHPLRFQITA